MANNGNPSNNNVGRGLPPLPGVHLPRPRTRGTEEALISLTQPRPQPDREANVYIETPFKQQVRSQNSSASTSFVSGRDKSVTFKRGASPSVKQTKCPPITSQPRSVTFKKEFSSENIEPSEDHGDSIICKSCGRCTCESCRRAKPLPSKWLCHEKCLCSAKTCVEYFSCLCCVKAIFYHCSKDIEGDMEGASVSDKPCSCSPHRRCYRWGCMGVLSVVLPCLCLYWPLKGCTKLCEMGYQSFSRKGCQCATNSPPQVEKRLLSNVINNS